MHICDRFGINHEQVPKLQAYIILMHMRCFIFETLSQIDRSECTYIRRAYDRDTLHYIYLVCVFQLIYSRHRDIVI